MYGLGNGGYIFRMDGVVIWRMDLGFWREWLGVKSLYVFLRELDLGF